LHEVEKDKAQDNGEADEPEYSVVHRQYWMLSTMTQSRTTEVEPPKYEIMAYMLMMNNVTDTPITNQNFPESVGGGGIGNMLQSLIQLILNFLLCLNVTLLTMSPPLPLFAFPEVRTPGPKLKARPLVPHFPASSPTHRLTQQSSRRTASSRSTRH